MGLALLLAATLAAAGVAKLRDPSGLTQAVQPFVGARAARPAVVALALCECLLAVALVTGIGRTGAAVVTAALMVGFIGALGVLRRRAALTASPIACNCFGSSSETGLGTGQVRNALLAAAAVALAAAPVDGVVGADGVASVVLAACLASGLVCAWQLSLALTRLRGVTA